MKNVSSNKDADKRVRGQATDEEKIFCKVHTWQRTSYPQYIKNFNNSTKRKWIRFKNMQDLSIHSSLIYSHISIRMLKMKSLTETKAGARQMWNSWNCHMLIVGMQTVQRLWKQSDSFYKVTRELSVELSKLTPRYLPKTNEKLCLH